MIRTVRLWNFKSFNSLELELAPLSVLFGPNASGKSNLLDALQLLARLCTKETLKDAFERPYRGAPLESVTLGAGGLKEILRQKSVHLRFEIDLELSEQTILKVQSEISETGRDWCFTERFVRYGLQVEVRPQSGILRVSDEYFAALKRDGHPKAQNAYVEKEGNRLHVRRQGVAGHPLFFDLGLDRTIVSMTHYAPHYPYLCALRREFENWLFLYFEPREKMRSPGPVKEVRSIGPMGEELPAFMNTLRLREPDDRQFHALEKSLKMMVPYISGIKTRVNEYGEVELLIDEQGIEIPASVISEGTLRTLGLLSLSALKTPPTLIGFEEPENGIHPKRMRLVAELLRSLARRSQIIITTHSPILIDTFADRELYVCSKHAGQSSIIPFSKVSASGLFREADVAGHLDAEEVPVSHRLLRGDFDD